MYTERKDAYNPILATEKDRCREGEGEGEGGRGRRRERERERIAPLNFRRRRNNGRREEGRGREDERAARSEGMEFVFYFLISNDTLLTSISNYFVLAFV